MHCSRIITIYIRCEGFGYFTKMILCRFTLILYYNTLYRTVYLLFSFYFASVLYIYEFICKRFIYTSNLYVMRSPYPRTSHSSLHSLFNYLNACIFSFLSLSCLWISWCKFAFIFWLLFIGCTGKKRKERWEFNERFFYAKRMHKLVSSMRIFAFIDYSTFKFTVSLILIS